MRFSKILILIIGLISVVQSAKILGIFVVPSRSHVILASTLLKQLTLRGHNVTMISPFPLEEPIPNYRDIILTEFKEEIMSKMFYRNLTTFEFIKLLFNTPNFGVDFIMRDKALIKFLESDEKFDLVIQEWGFTEGLLGIGYKVGGKTIGMSVTGSNPFTNYLFNVPAPYSYVPSIFLPYSDDMTFLERTINTFVSVTFDLFYKYFAIEIQRNALQKYFPDAPPIEDLMDDVDILLSCSQIVTETIRPTFPNIIQIGGFHLYEKQELPKDLEIYLNNSSNGVVLFSFGTIVKTEHMPNGVEDVFMNAFAKLPYNILWKSSRDFKNIPMNIKIVKWLPQRAVLAHHNVKAFITHGGLGGTSEAIFHAVPMIGLPHFGDQYKNVIESKKRGILIHIDPDQITEEKIIKAVTDVIENPIYKKNSNHQSDLIRNQEMNPMDKAVFWVEHVIKHKGAKHLKSRAAKISFYQYYLLDVLSFILLILFIFIFILILILKCIIKSCCKAGKIKTS